MSSTRMTRKSYLTASKPTQQLKNAPIVGAVFLHQTLKYLHTIKLLPGHIISPKVSISRRLLKSWFSQLQLLNNSFWSEIKVCLHRFNNLFLCYLLCFKCLYIYRYWLCYPDSIPKLDFTPLTYS